MGSVPKQAPLIVIVGQTASGKSALALDIAKQFNGEIICADSRTVYRGMNIGTAKPTVDEQAAVPHHLLDVAAPDEPFTVADFKHATLMAIQEISDRNRLPIMVGGSGLYVDSVIYDYQFSDAGAERDGLNPRHLKKTNEPAIRELRPNTLVIGLQVEKDVLEQRIRDRVDQMVQRGFVDEVKALSEQFDVSAKAFGAPGYKAFLAHLQGELNSDEAKQQFVRSDMQLAKRQRTWFKRNKSIHWISNTAQAKSLIQNFLSNQPTTS